VLDRLAELVLFADQLVDPGQDGVLVHEYTLTHVVGVAVVDRTSRACSQGRLDECVWLVCPTLR
jgi:hypothetical protein